MSVGAELTVGEISNRWPRIGRFLRLEPAGWIEDNLIGFSHVQDTWSPADRAAAYGEWASFYEWRLERRAEELAGDRSKRHGVEQWTDDMVYLCRRQACWARGEHPGAWVPSWERRPDLDAEQRAIIEEIIARLDADSPLADGSVQQLRRVG